ncbi:hypothetical protein IE81DRAFT_257082 [Ceraceosorus guamensis]|uniref:Pyruvate decarboxylase n=1 Tax=Ceraceosorus guamensis TaxID=1522189 RepID=A0A316VQA1_9BASI|nr:hypothetical protein IE81DRAFT_257082 [Ceraceosorus guamensis]PWN39819.1 hypothetical protein IE81DRAFT_257082 [Ceraceosorus guamensis]
MPALIEKPVSTATALALPRDDRPSSVFVGNFLLHRLRQLGLGTVFGCPGDFTFGICDLIDDNSGLEWAGNANELGAAYAADGYARVSSCGFAAVVTTWGVGELSALNGLGGAYAERLPVLHIVGSPPRAQVAKKLPIHHSFANGDFDSFSNMSRPISCAHEQLTGDAWSDADKIDHVLRTALRERRPAYLNIPTDVVFELIPRERLAVPLNAWHYPTSANASLPSTPPQEEAFAIAHAPSSAQIQACVGEILRVLSTAADPVVILDVNLMRFGHTKRARKLVNALGLPTFAAPLSKGLIDETSPLFGGTFVGASTLPHIKERIDQADIVVRIGHLRSDTNTGGFSADIEPERLLDINLDCVTFPAQNVHVAQTRAAHNLDLATIIADLTSQAELLRKTSTALGGGKPSRLISDSEDATVSSKLALSRPPLDGLKLPLERTPLTHNYMWPRFGEFFEQDDIVVVDTGTSSFGITDVRLSKNCNLVSQMLYNSIGWSTGAAVGAAVAAREDYNARVRQAQAQQDQEAVSAIKEPRVVLIVGDGALQMTAQEISTFIRLDLKPLIFVLNNSGYTIERALHGPHRDYNGIVDWRYADLVRTFGAHEDKHRSHIVETVADFDDVLQRLASGDTPNVLSIVDVRLDKLDAPRILAALGSISQARNAYGYAPEYNH